MAETRLDLPPYPSLDGDPESRLVMGMLHSVTQRGFADTRIIDVVTAAGMSKQTFYEYFESKEDCFLKAYELHTKLNIARMRRVATPPGTWQEKTWRTTHTVVSDADAHPVIARAILQEVKAAGPKAARMRRAAAEDWAQLISDIVAEAGERPPFEFCLMISAAHDDYLAWLVASGDFDVEKETNVMWEFLVSALS